MTRLWLTLLTLATALPWALAPCATAEPVAVVADVYSGDDESKVTDQARGEELVARATELARMRQPTAALQLATQALTVDPDNEVARRVLGYEQKDDQPNGQWLTPYQAKQVGRGYVWHAKYGWIKQDDVDRYEADERRHGRRLLTAEEDAARHATIDDGWQVRTDHFLVTTNHSLEAGAMIAAELEKLFQVWRQLFAGYYLGDAEVQARFDGTRSARQRSRPYNVIYHRSKQEYVAALRHKQPQIDKTLGIYFDDLREAHFFAGETIDRATLYHEGVHQLFKESVRSRREVGMQHGFWLVEGIACYFESLTPPADEEAEWTIGGPNGGRLPAARHRLIVDKFYVPLAELAALGKLDLQRRPDLAALYSQSAGLAAYLMEGEKGAMREPLVGHLRALYEGDATPDDLFERLERTPGELDAGYRRWLATGLEPAASLPQQP
ncbi:hypothetical protein Pla123a_07670 [Posidoniimonas polymericola]|uniref:DUF1570 domain-containing protein n=1 Tax=Posidoniimonas polymericola TaxID=2528002 RepID=A0A5C5ZEU5_9BACT|nr:hypothetical protein [Posidoniimonas polymericola]TWT85959.1 hypothetical protein Pla123a_07670 [Posidoniimonas polymericola]